MASVTSIFDHFNETEPYKKVSEYKTLGTKWTDEEIRELKRLYLDNKFDISTISNRLNRYPGTILTKLNVLDITKKREKARGYKEFVNSKYYHTILQISVNKWNDLNANTKRYII
jgi:hypothetical protein